MQLLPWLQDANDAFNTLLNRQQVAHAYLIGLDAGYGGETLALMLAKASLCSQVGVSAACGFCKACQLIEANSHPDFYKIEADGAQIKVDQIRTLCQKLTTTAQQGGRRVAVILNCERLNQASANALLKTLEEPGKDTILFLQANTPSRLMATISSRCQRIQVKLPSRVDVKSWLSDELKASDDYSWCLPVVGGPLAIVSAIESGRYQSLLDFRKGWIQSLSSAQLCASLQNVNEKQVSDAIKVLYLVLHRKLVKDQAMDPLIRASIAVFAAKVMQQETRLSVMPTVNTLGLFEGIVREYTQLLDH
ncbi:DNA polymerase III subunit delta' [Shewanella sp. KX20019]|uniref:DNA polymerase III subunit delta' n=1 Tax=Shewanella sp. KX20019 TaxID=2803864 RepID=UPI0019289679|nr:DNA polymerase III subunit delta' [Shewanella sp. KX20019]QQX82161.1 DNA polymerase III subunit delta' [Shewanella sp. KX20019]